MRVLGIDGGLAHLGWAIAELPRVVINQPGHYRASIVGGGVIETTPREEGTRADSHRERAVEVYEQLVAVVQKHKPDEVCAEAFSPPRDSRNASMLAWSWGVVTAVAAQFGIPVRTKSPMPLKKALAGVGTAKKPEMISAALRLYPESQAFFPRRQDLHEHLADAIAAIHFFHGVAA